ncbi:MAG: hypothetical protein FWE98_04565 [Oscillospiraceae bacterium]|nr:hypothetical protein [Oscillospiraceae bacterium]
MNEGKRKKVLRYTLYGLYFVTCAAFAYLTSSLPRKLGVEWIIGWPEFVGNLLGYAPVIAALLFLLPKIPKTLKQPEFEKVTSTRKTLLAVLSVLPLVIIIGLSVVVSFFTRWQKIDRYELSPSGKNKAIVMVRKGNDPWMTEYVHPVRAWLFYEDKNGIYLHPDSEEITFTWLDDYTLEITRTREYEGESWTETDQIKW